MEVDAQKKTSNEIYIIRAIEGFYIKKNENKTEIFESKHTLKQLDIYLNQ